MMIKLEKKRTRTVKRMEYGSTKFLTSVRYVNDENCVKKVEH